MKGLVVVLAGLLVLANPVMAQSGGDPEGGDPQSGDPGSQNATQGGSQNTTQGAQNTSGSSPSTTSLQSIDSPSCEVVRWYGAARPTYIVVDPDRCFVPDWLRETIYSLL